jgi:hypothetical protein
MQNEEKDLAPRTKNFARRLIYGSLPPASGIIS